MPASVDTAALRQAIVATLKRQIGKPYVWGAAGPNSFDCSGLGMYAYQANGVTIPHNSVQQYDASAREAGPGPADAIFLNFDADGPQHVVWCAGGSQAVAAPHTGALVEMIDWTQYPGRHAFGTFLGPSGTTGPSAGDSGAPVASQGAPGAVQAAGVGCATLVVQAIMVVAILVIGCLGLAGVL